MNYRNFNDYVASFNNYHGRLALTNRPFLKIERLTFGELQLRAYQTTEWLRHEGIAKGDRVLIVAGNTPAWLELFLGVQLAGAILVAVDVMSTEPTIQRYIDDTTPKLIFKNNYLHPELKGSSKVLPIESLEDLIGQYPGKPPKPSPAGDQPGLIVFTSGTTADPKGVVLSQANILANVTGIQLRIDIDPNWRALSVLPLSHMYELTGSLALLSGGASIFYIQRVTPNRIARALNDYHISVILAIPQLLILLLERIRQIAADEGKSKALDAALKIAAWLPFSSRRYLFKSVHNQLGGQLKLVVTGGAPIPLEVAKAWECMGVRMVQGYGLTETSPILTVNGLNSRRLDSPGQVLENLRLRIDGKGEIQAKGPSIFKQYWQNPVATAEAFTDSGWFKTGDIGYLRSGWLHIQGRLKFTIVLSSGLKVFPEDIEMAAVKQPAFKEFCAVGLRQPSGETVMAVVISNRSDKIINAAISNINSKLESFQHIDGWRRWPDSDFPRTRLLKIDRKQVQLWANQNIRPPIKTMDPGADNDQLLKIIRLSLSQPGAKIKETDRLADIGLDSLRRLNVVSLIEARMGVTIAEETISQTTTVANLRKLISRGSQTLLPSRPVKWPFKKWVRLAGNAVRETLLRAVIRVWVKLKRRRPRKFKQS